MGAMAKGQRGFTLAEALAVLVIVLVAAAFAYRALDARNKGAVAESFILSEARELKELAAAARSYAAQNKASWVANTTYFAYIAQLSATTPPLLPTTWAQRGGTAGLTPIGETYRAIFRKDSSGVVRIVITDYGNGIPSSDVRIRQAGYLKTAASLDGYKIRVADQYAKLTDGGYSGVVAANTMSARAPGGGFTQDLTAYFNSTAPTYPVAVVLVGWPEYRGGDDGDEEGYEGSCRVVLPVCSGGGSACGSSSTYVPAVCPNGYTQRDSWPMCQTGVRFRTTPTGASLSIIQSESYASGPDVNCDAECSGPPHNSNCGSNYSQVSFDEVLLNTAVLARGETPGNGTSSICGWQGYANFRWSNGNKICGGYQAGGPGVDDRALQVGQTATAILCCN